MQSGSAGYRRAGGSPIRWACLLIALGALVPSWIHAQAATARIAAPSPVHTPFVSDPHPDDSAEYRKAVTDIAALYTRLYYGADLRAALDEAKRGLDLALTHSRPRDEAQFLKAAGYVSWLLGDTAAAAEYEQRLLNLAERFDDNALRSIAHRVLGSVYRQTGDRGLSRRYTEEALRFAKEAGDQGLADGALNNLGVIAMEDGDLAEARRLHEEVLAHREATGNQWDAAGSVTNLADVALAANEIDRALSLHQRAYAMRREVGDTRGQMRSLRQVATALRRLGRMDEALAQLQEASARTEEITGHELLGDLWREIALTREARGEFAEALAAERRANTEREALAGERTRARIAELETRYDLAKKQQTIEALDKENTLRSAEMRLNEIEWERTQFQYTALIALFAAGAIGLGAVISRQRFKLAAERRLRDAAEQADQLKTRLLSIASHDLRNPLGNIHFVAGDLRRDSVGRPPDDDRLEIIEGESQRLLVLVQDLVDTAALDIGRLELRKAPFDLEATLRSVMSEFTWQAQGKQQQLILRKPALGAGQIVADERRLHQVISNLIGNAIKYTPTGRTVTLELERASAQVLIRVRDEGPGLSPKDIERLFTPFTRLSAQPTGGESSHGLGLSIAHEIVRLHGGRITVDSTPGAGSVFIVELPA